MNLPTLPLYVLYFFFYSAVGWLIESIYCSCGQRKLVNRGFLTGPLCPIYGSGAVALGLCLSPIKNSGLNPWAKFFIILFLGMIICDFVEFMTSVIMEKLFHARWWDYSNKPFNIQGRICLQHTMYWGLATVIFMYVIHPPVEELIAQIDSDIAYILLGFIFAAFIADLINAVRVALDVRKLMDKLHAINDAVQKHAETAKETIQQNVNKSVEVIANFTAELNEQADALQLQFNKFLKERNRKDKKSERPSRLAPSIKKKIKQELSDMKKSIDSLKDKSDKDNID